MKTGDIIQMRAPDVPLPEFPAAVVEVSGDDLEVLSTFLVPFRHPGKFKLSRVETMVTCPAEQAVERETGFPLGARCRTTLRDGSVQEGAAAVGFDGILVIRRDDGELVTGGRNFFTAV